MPLNRKDLEIKLTFDDSELDALDKLKSGFGQSPFGPSGSLGGRRVSNKNTGSSGASSFGDNFANWASSGKSPGKAMAGMNMNNFMSGAARGFASGGAKGAVGAMSGAIGGAMGGPVGLIISMLPELAKMSGEIQKMMNPITHVNSAFKTLNTSLKGLQGPLGAIGLAFDGVSAGFDMMFGHIKDIPLVGDLLGGVIDQYIQAPKIIKETVGILTEMAGKVSPAHAERMALAIDDTSAVIGRAFLPVMEVMTDTLRGFGDVMATIIPSSDEMRSVLEEIKPSLYEMGNAFKEVYRHLGPFIRKSFITGFRVLGTVISAVAKAVTTVTQAFSGFLSMIGFQREELRSSRGLAYRQAQMQSFGSYAEEIYTNAYSMGSASPQEETVSQLNILNTTARAILAVMTGGMSEVFGGNGRGGGGSFVGGMLGVMAGGGHMGVISMLIREAIRGF